MARRESKIYLGAASIRLSELNHLIERHERAEGGDVPQGSARRAGESSEFAKLREEFEQVQAEADEVGDFIVVRPLRDDEWDNLCEAHPPRTDKRYAEVDDNLGFNAQSGRRALIFAALVEPSLATREEFNDWVERKELTRGEMEGIALQVWQLTNRQPYAPK